MQFTFYYYLNNQLNGIHVICEIYLAPLISLDINSKMDYLTPIKETIEIKKQNQTASQIREGDWVCLNCSNFNFSFRKKCNRCKSQTR